MMTAKGCIVYRPSLTGLGERVHLANAQIGLQTHINDVVNLILFEDLYDVILVGHSYGGMVITGVADSLPGRIKKLIYLDAFLPDSGESVMSIYPGLENYFDSLAANGFMIPPWLKPGTPLPHDVPQPLKTFTDTLSLKHRNRQPPAIYILTVEKGTDPSKDNFAAQADRARKRGMKVLQLTADHNPQWSAPEDLSEMLYQNK